MNLLRISCAIACALPAACATPGGGPLGLVALDPNNHVSGAEPLVGTRKQQCDAATLMAVFSPQTQEANAGAASAKVDECTRIQRSVAWALRAHPGTPYSKEGRNEAVGFLMAESDRKCDTYTQFIEQYSSNVTSGFGILSHAASTIAAITTGGTAQALASGASIASDAGGRLSKGHFHEQTIPIIVAAYQAARDKIRKEVDDVLKKNISDYGLSSGVRDAYRYHAHCSVSAGINTTNQAVQEKAARDKATTTTDSGGKTAGTGTGTGTSGSAGGTGSNKPGGGTSGGGSTGGTSTSPDAPPATSQKTGG